MLREKIKARWFWLARWMCRVFCILFFRVRVYGVENVPDKGAFLLVSNHQSYLDPIFCGVPLKRHLHFLARDSLFSNRFFGGLISSVNTIPVKRGEADLAAMRKVIDVLKKGAGVCLFPEGTRSHDGKIMQLKPGFGLLCRRGNAAVIPVVIDGAFECWPRHKRIFSFGTVSVCYGKMVSAEQVRNMGDSKLAAFLTDKMQRIQTKSRLKRGKKPYDYSS